MTIVVDLLVFAILIFAAFSGSRQGFFGVALKFFGRIAAYLAAGFAVKLYAADVAWAYDLSIVLSALIIGGLTFFVFSTVISITQNLIKKSNVSRDLDEDKEEDLGDTPLPWSRWSGATLNVIMYMLLLTFAFWFYDLVRFSQFGRDLPDVSSSLPSQGARKIIRQAIYVANYNEDDEGTRALLLAEVASSPANALQNFKNILSHPVIQDLIHDDDILDDLTSGDATRLAGNTSLKKIFEDEDAIEELKTLGLIMPDEDLLGLCERLKPFSHRIHEVVHEESIRQEIDALRNSPGFDSSDTASLIKNPRFLRIVDRVFKEALRPEGINLLQE